MNIELSLSIITSYAYAAIAAAAFLFAEILSIRFIYSFTEFATVALMSFLFFALPIWWQTRKLNKHFKLTNPD